MADMKWNWLIWTGCMLFFLPAYLHAQAGWEQKMDRDGIKVFMRNMDNSPLKAVKTVCTINTSLSILTAVLLDIPGSAEWVYATKKIAVLKKNSPSELLYYSELNIPWPVTNRDFIVLLTVT